MEHSRVVVVLASSSIACSGTTVEVVAAVAENLTVYHSFAFVPVHNARSS